MASSGASGARLARALEAGLAAADASTPGEEEVHGIDLSEGGSAPAGMCCECRDQPHTLLCAACGGDLFCAVCFVSVHRGGRRREHRPTDCPSPLLASLEAASSAAVPVSASPAPGAEEDAMASAAGGALATASIAGKRSSAEAPHAGGDRGDEEGEREDSAEDVIAASVSHDWEAMAKVTPLRLTFEERRLLRLIEAALHVG